MLFLFNTWLKKYKHFFCLWHCDIFILLFEKKMQMEVLYIYKFNGAHLMRRFHVISRYSFTEKYDILPSSTNCYAPLKKCFCLFEFRRSCKISKNFSYFLNTRLIGAVFTLPVVRLFSLFLLVFAFWSLLCEFYKKCNCSRSFQFF